MGYFNKILIRILLFAGIILSLAACSPYREHKDGYNPYLNAKAKNKPSAQIKEGYAKANEKAKKQARRQKRRIKKLQSQNGRYVQRKMKHSEK